MRLLLPIQWQRDPPLHQPLEVERGRNTPCGNRLDDCRGQQRQSCHPRDVDLRQPFTPSDVGQEADPASGQFFETSGGRAPGL